MDIKLFSLCKQENAEFAAGQKYILDCVKSFFPECEDFINFTSQKRMLIAASQSLRAVDVVILAVQGSMYNATKRLLCQALDLKLVKNREIDTVLSPLFADGKLKENVYTANIAFPKGAEILPTDDGINSGFVLSSGSQHIIYIPIEDDKAGEVVFGSLYDFFADCSDSVSASATIKLRHEHIIARTASKLKEAQVKVAVPHFICGDRIASLAGDNSAAESSFVFASSYEDKMEDISYTDYFVSIARKIREENHTHLGAAVSDVIDEDGENVVYIAVADESGTNVTKIFAEDGENPKSFIDICIDKLMLMLYNYDRPADSDGVKGDSKHEKKYRRMLTIVSAAVVGASAAIGIIIALITK